MPRISPSFPPFLPASPRRGFLADLAEPDSQIAIKKLSSGSSASSVSTLSGGLPIKSPKKGRCGCSALLRSALSTSQGKIIPRQPGVNIEAFDRFRREAHQLVVESATAVVDLMRQRGVGPVQIVCAAEVLEPLHRHRGVEAVHFGRLDQCKVDAISIFRQREKNFDRCKPLR